MAFAQSLIFQVGELSLPWDELRDFWDFVEEIKQWGLYRRGEQWPVGRATAATISKIEMKTIKLVRVANGDFRVSKFLVMSTDYIGSCFPLTLDLQATDPRDKLFALHSLRLSRVAPDYSKDVRQVYIESAAASVQTYGSPDILEYAGIDLAENLNLPSWVPDWQALSHVLPEAPVLQTLGHFTALRRLYRNQAYGKLSQKARVTNTDSLAAYGFKCAEVSDVAHSSAWAPADFLRHFRQRRRHSNSAEDTAKRLGYQQGLPELQVFLRTIFMDINPLGKVFQQRLLDADNFNRTVDVLRTFLHNELSQCYNTGDFKTLYGFDPQNPRFAGFVHDHILTEADREQLQSNLYMEVSSWGSLESGTSFDENNATGISSHLQKIAKSTFCFHTSDGDVGIGPPQVRVGDQICVLGKCTFPVVLRPVGGHYRYIGPCFIVGLTEGEASKTLEAEGAEPVEFDIR
ncbi:hypothetical protein AOQ84DRAFT_385641 [Glonium stellatum]|uniref:Uncharacterized protein n=1 Tax=Glonium stellatum TaxID=574774 RepID=A0A8E2FA19_9PEZI|nr:hypothetical protein AOQ84DRAFT_385641 [Glonium stellatum]